MDYEVHLTFEGDPALAAQWGGFAKKKARELGQYCVNSGARYSTKWIPINDEVKIKLRFSNGIQYAHIIANAQIHGIAFWPRTTSYPAGWGMPYTEDNRPMGTYDGQWPDIIATEDSKFGELDHDYVAKIARGPVYGSKLRLLPEDNIDYGQITWRIGEDVYSTKRHSNSWYFYENLTSLSDTFYLAGRAYFGTGKVLGIFSFSGVRFGIFKGAVGSTEELYRIVDMNDSDTWELIATWSISPYNTSSDGSLARPLYYKFSSDGKYAARLLCSTTFHAILQLIVFAKDPDTGVFSATVTYQDLGLHGIVVSRTGTDGFPATPSVGNQTSFSGVAGDTYYVGHRGGFSVGYTAGWNWSAGTFSVPGDFYVDSDASAIFAESHADYFDALTAILPHGPFIGPFTDGGYTLGDGSPCDGMNPSPNGFTTAVSTVDLFFDQEPPDPDTPWSFGSSTSAIPVADITYTTEWDLPSTGHTYSIGGVDYLCVDFVPANGETPERLALLTLEPDAGGFVGFSSFTRTASAVQLTGQAFPGGLMEETKEYSETYTSQSKFEDPHKFVIKMAPVGFESAGDAAAGLTTVFDIPAGSNWTAGNCDAKEVFTKHHVEAITYDGASTRTRTASKEHTVTWSGVGGGQAISKTGNESALVDMDLGKGIIIVQRVLDEVVWPAGHSNSVEYTPSTSSYDPLNILKCKIEDDLIMSRLDEPETSLNDGMYIIGGVEPTLTGGPRVTNRVSESTDLILIDYKEASYSIVDITPPGVTVTTSDGAQVISSPPTPVNAASAGRYPFFLFLGAQMVTYKNLGCLAMTTPTWSGRPYSAYYQGYTVFFNRSGDQSDAHAAVGVNTVTLEKMMLPNSGNRFGVI